MILSRALHCISLTGLNIRCEVSLLKCIKWVKSLSVCISGGIRLRGLKSDALSLMTLFFSRYHTPDQQGLSLGPTATVSLRAPVIPLEGGWLRVGVVDG